MTEASQPSQFPELGGDASARSGRLSASPLSPLASVRPLEGAGRDPRRPASVPLLVVTTETASPVSRRSGPRGELSVLSARVRSAGRARDASAERTAAIALARAFAARGTELEQATKLARRALLLGEDPVLREDLAAWFALLGEPALAAATLKPLLASRSGKEGLALRLHLATLFCRAGEARAAREILEDATAVAPDDAEPAELLASISAWAPDVVPRDYAAGLHLQAAECRRRARERAAALECTIRAFDIAPDSPRAAERLAAALAERGRHGAADEVRRQHAHALGPLGWKAHRQRFRLALRDGELIRALGAALDARLEAELDLKSVLSVIAGEEADGPDGLDGVLERLGMFDLLAVRLELSSEVLAGRERARVLRAVARLHGSVLGRPERAIEAWVEAFVADPDDEEAHEALLRYAAATRDPLPLVDALLRAAAPGSRLPPTERVRCLRELLKLAEGRLDDPCLAEYCLKELIRLVPDEAELLLTELDTRKEEAERARRTVQMLLAETPAGGPERIEGLRRLVRKLGAAPEHAELLLATLLELAEADPSERRVRIAVERLLLRQERYEELEAFHERLVARAESPIERARLRLAVAKDRRRRGELDGALAELVPLLDAPVADAAGLSFLLVLATEQGDERTRARTLVRLATELSEEPRAVLLAVAAEILLSLGDVDGARAAADRAVGANPTETRAIAARAAVGARTLDAWGAEAMERALGVIAPSASLCQALADTYERLGDAELALAFSQRRVAIRAGDVAAACDRLERACRTGDGARLADTLSWLLAQPLPMAELARPVARALRTLSRLDPPRASALARRALDISGPRSAELREVVLEVADAAGESGLAIATLERWLAAGAPTRERPALLFDVCRRRRDAGDADGAARALVRALAEGAPGSAILAELENAPPARTSDGVIAQLTARAEALAALSEADYELTARAFRELGAAYWDLASDALSALHAWERAIALDPSRGLENFAADLVAFAGSETALVRLEEYADRCGVPTEAARALGLAAGLALDAGRRSHALVLGIRALFLDPGRTGVLAIVERAAGPDDVAALESAYGAVADATPGRHGERAVHYRAARRFEALSAFGPALAHAVRAFELAPSTGAVFVVMVRLGERARDMAEVIRVIERAASAAEDPDRCADFLRRAAALSASTDDGLLQRLEVLLRALALRPDAEILSALGSTAHELTLRLPEERATVELRVTRAVRALLPRLEGAAGVELAFTAAELLLDTFDAAGLACAALERAFAIDPKNPGFSRFLPRVPLLAAESGPLLERLVAAVSADGSAPGSAVLELGAELARLGPGDPVSVELLAHAACVPTPSGVPSMRAADVVTKLALRGEFGRALAVLERERAEAPRSRELLEAWVRVAHLANDKHELSRALAELVELLRGTPDELGFLRELAEVLEAIGEREGALARWEEVLRLDGTDTAALLALERDAEARGAYELLLELLDRRAGLTTSASELRSIRLRRAAVLEQRLGRAEEARGELEHLLASTGDSLSVLCMLADLDERLGAPLAAAELWVRASALARDTDQASELLGRGCEAYLAGGDAESARRTLFGLAERVRPEKRLELLVEIERRHNDPLALAEALEALAAEPSIADERRAALLVEAAEASLAAGAQQAALERALAAAALAPTWPEAQLLARSLEYRRRGAGTVADARATIEALDGLAHLTPEQTELAAFLRAEALDLCAGANAGRVELERAEAAVGPRPLIALGIAERLSGAGDLLRGLAYYDVALGGDLLGLRRRAEVAFRAAQIARALADPVRMKTYLEIAAQDPAAREHATQLGFELLAEHETDTRAEAAPGRQSVVPAAPGESRPRPPARRPLLVLEDSMRPPPPDDAPPVSGPISSGRAGPPSSEGRRAAEHPRLEGDEAVLYEAFIAGSFDAGRELVLRLEQHPERVADRLLVCRKLVAAQPANRFALEKLHDAALADDNIAHARAIEHVLSVLVPGREPVRAPPLSELEERSDAVRALLLRDLDAPALEALGLVWEGAEHVFRRDPSTYGVTGLERVPAGAPTPLARAFAATARALGMARTPLFQRRSAGSITVSLALLSPPAIVVSGDIRQETPELIFHLATMLLGTLPPFLLLFGASEAQARAVLQALRFAFGPPRPGSNSAGVPALAEIFWESIPARHQRRLREICEDNSALEYDRAMALASIAARRAGLLVTGDLGLSLRETCIEERIALDRLSSEADLGELCATDASIRSLFQMATSLEYAEVRFRPARSRGGRPDGL
ncbi:MAG: hypothetical protein DIU78_012075 [Pseudomonadota bacterium]